jgi:hypothetical protein
MHPIGTPEGMPYLGRAWRLAGHEARFTSRGDLPTKPRMHVLSVGRIEPGTLLRHALLDAQDFRVSFVPDYRELWISAKQHEIHAVVLHNSLCSFELAEAARLVRVRWPGARILVIRSGQLSLDRGLYDQRLHSPLRHEVLVQHIVNLAHALQEGGHSGKH